MTSQIKRFFIVLSVLYVLGFALAIYVPNEATTKPPKRREPVLPWYPVGTDKDYIDSTEDTASQRSPKWRATPDDEKPRKPIIVDADTKTWSPWRKKPGSEIEQRTEIHDDRQVNFDQNRNPSLDNKQLEQQENQDASLPFEDQATDHIYLKDKTKGSKTTISHEENKRKTEAKNDFYEGVSNDRTKPQKEEIVLPTKPRSTVARYDSRLGVQCPTSDATGQFTYPPDCKFFVNCWKGRAFVQPCAPGTLFNPDTLECDFPHKVRCYGGEIVEFPSTGDLDSTGRHEPLIAGSHRRLYPEKIQEVKCPPHITGLIAHPTNCTQFLQCANGGTFIKDCGPGTVFNPAISVCDWPRNVRGCEDALKTEEDRNPLAPPFHSESFDHGKLKYNEPATKKIVCPPDYTGLLPHPETCKKFLQCANGGTFIMDCGPGTAFNPLISVCDWPYNVPGCSESTTVKPWSAWSHQNSKPSQTYHPQNQTTTENKPTWWSSGHNYHTTTSLPKTDWDTLRPTWRPSWKSDAVMTTTPTYDHHGSYNQHETTGYFDHHPTSGYDHSNGQWLDHRADNDDNRHNGDQDYNYEHHQHAHQHGHQYGHQHGHHYGYHHGHQHDRHPSKPYDQNIGQSPPPYDSSHGHPSGYPTSQGRKHDPESPGPGWYPDYRPGNRDKPWKYPIPDYPDESDEFHQQVSQTPYQTHDKGRTPNEAFDGNRDTTAQQETGIQSNRRTGHEFPDNRQEYGRTNPWFAHPEFPQRPAPDVGNIYVDHGYNVPPEGKINSSRNISTWNGQTNNTVIWSSRDRTNWNQAENPGGPGFRPSNWDGQQDQLPSQSQTTQWEQGTLTGDDRLREWETRTKIHEQSSIDRGADAKVNEWTSNQNVFQHANGQTQIGTDKHRTLTPSTNLQPPFYEPPSRSWTSSSSYQPSKVGSHYPPVPATDLQPPFLDSSHSDSSSVINQQTINSQHPQVPAKDLLPPYYHSPSVTSPHATTPKDLNNWYPAIPAGDLQPPFDDPSNRRLDYPDSTKSPVFDNQYPVVPAGDLLPPLYESPNGRSDSPYTTKSPVFDSQHPVIPAGGLLPPLYESPNGRSDSPYTTTSPAFDSQHPVVPARDLLPPMYESPNGQSNSPYATKSPIFDSQHPVIPARDLLPPIYESPNGQSNSPYTTKSPVFDSQHPVIPARDLLPPLYEPPSGRSDIPYTTESPVFDNQYPAIPASNLQPPFYDFSNNRRDYPDYPEQRPVVPAGDLLPPFYESPDGRSDSQYSTKSPIFDSQHPVVPATNLLPPLYDSPIGRSDSQHTTKSPVFDSQHSIVPASDLLPPLYESPNRLEHISNSTATSHVQSPLYQTPNYSTDYPHPTDGSYNNHPAIHTETTTQRTPDIHLTVPTRRKVESTTQRAETLSTTTDPNVNNVSKEYKDQSTKKFVDVVEPDIDYEVDVLDDKDEWKPVLVFENKTKTTTESSVIMKINKKKVDVDLFNIEAAPYADDEPPFPVYYVPSVQPLSHSKKSALPTPISGQAVRLRGGSGPHDGYVEVQGINPGWGVVCDSRNSWTLKEAHVVCRQLGYSRGAEMAWQGRNNRNTVPTWIAANSVACTGNETRFQSCKFTHDTECRVERDAIGVRCTPNRVALCRKDEMPYEGQCYHLTDPDNGLNHAEASNYCAQRQARLIDITNQQENDFISEWLVQLHPEVGSIMTSGLGFTTLNRTFWLWEDSSRAKFRFTKWWPGWMEDKKHPPFVGARPLCVLMKRKFPCHERSESICVADYFFWDAEDCASSAKGHSYICKRPYDDIGCVYGKGVQYAGTANVTASGKDCLPWSDPKVSHRLTVTVVNRDIREKLKTHNYCRNPNPSRETRPWCFAEPSGERESCDIPPCGSAEIRSAASTSQCKPNDFQCVPGVCIPSRWVCDGKEDCSNGADEKSCKVHLNLFQKHAGRKLEGYDVEKWLNTPLKACALRCKEADFTCRSFAHKAIGNICLLSDSNIGMTGSLVTDKEFDYYEMKERSINCDGMFVCENRKCINQTKVCNGKNDCGDRSDESICTVENLDYAIRLAGSNNSHEGRIEVKILGVWGQVCDDGFGMISADVICKELGFELGVLEIRPGGFYGNLDPPTRFMVDQLKCQGNETSLRQCDFEGWGVHNCQPEEAVGVVCKTAVDSCQEGHWKCDNTRTCIPAAFICDEVTDCPDGSDESPEHCDAPFEIRLVNGSSRLQGRVEVRHHGIWGTVCDDDFSNATAAVICRSLGYGGVAIAKKNGFFGAGEGLIWLDEVFCHGNETQLYRCEHNHWGQHNCDHNEDAGVICTPGDVNDSKLQWEAVPDLPETDINDLLPANCGKRFKDFNDEEDLIFAKVVHGSVAPKGTYPWQASIRVRGHSRSSHWCGAVVLSSLHVLTAAHCLEGYNKGTYFVRAGDYNTEIEEGTEVEANIEDYYIHEDFRKGHRMNNDIALVLLKGRGIPLGKDIVPICLPSENTEYPAGLNCTISGFGSIETGKSTHSKDLRYGWVPLLDQSVCRAGHVYGEGAISSGMVCAGYLDEGVDTCDGDSGGPLACYQNGAFTLYGITSWGQHCGRANKPGVYVRVSHYRRWIDRKVRDSLLGR